MAMYLVSTGVQAQCCRLSPFRLLQHTKCWVAYKQQKFLPILEAEKPKVKVLTDLVSAGSLFPTRPAVFPL